MSDEEQQRITEAEATGRIVSTPDPDPQPTAPRDPWPVPKPVPPTGGWARFTIEEGR